MTRLLLKIESEIFDFLFHILVLWDQQPRVVVIIFSLWRREFWSLSRDQESLDKDLPRGIRGLSQGCLGKGLGAQCRFILASSVTPLMRHCYLLVYTWQVQWRKSDVIEKIENYLPQVLYSRRPHLSHPNHLYQILYSRRPRLVIQII